MIALLPENSRQAVRMFEVGGRPLREVAEALSLSLSDAKNRVQRGRRSLRQLVLDCCHLDFDRRGNGIGYEQRQCGREQC